MRVAFRDCPTFLCTFISDDLEESRYLFQILKYIHICADLRVNTMITFIISTNSLYLVFLKLILSSIDS